MFNVEKLLASIEHLDSYKRVDSTHPLDLYLGKDELSRWTMLLLCDAQPTTVSSSKMIITKTSIRADGRWVLVFSLVDDTYKDMFLMFCEDIIEASRNISERKTGAHFVLKRYNEWREMLAESRGDLLSPAEIKGLLGEMFFLKETLAECYGIEKAALSWTGPKKLPQDFMIDETWYEVKTISSNESDVTISSIEQLDSAIAGELIILNADKTSLTNENATNLNIIYRSIVSAISDDSVKASFCNMLLRFGYWPRQEYEREEYTFEIKKMYRYIVDSSFPCLRKSELPPSVTKAKYDISLAAISAFRKE